VTVGYAPVCYEKDTVELLPLTRVRITSTAKGHRREFGLGSGAWHSRDNTQSLNENCKLSNIGVDCLRKHKTVLRRLVDRGDALRKKRKLIVQRGGLLLPLLTEALSALISFIRL
jgi:hypothetical protein